MLHCHDLHVRSKMFERNVYMLLRASLIHKRTKRNCEHAITTQNLLSVDVNHNINLERIL